MRGTKEASALLVMSALFAACGARTNMRVDHEDAGRRDAGVRDAGPPDAGPVTCERELAITFTPTARTQIALWVEAGERFETLALTDATAYRGLGNRPGALQLNSGYRWPVGRRENVLPGWASSRLAAGGAPFRRVIYRNRPEGWVSSARTTPDAYRDTNDHYYCLPFDPSVSDRDHLDAVTCATPLSHDKGRYISDEDLAAGYSEPEESAPGVGGSRVLTPTSAYPPRRDMADTSEDHPDVARYAADALAIMPELDAVTMATPREGEPLTRTWRVPSDWPEGPIRVSLEVNTEGDYAPAYDPSSYPTPTMPDDAWDSWGRNYGYPYRGQPSVIFDVEIDVLPRVGAASPRTVTAAAPTRRGTLDGSLAVLPIDGTIVDDPALAPGSGADRLRRAEDGARVVVEMRQVDCRP